MKIAIVCKSPLLQKSLELFLSNYLSSTKRCDAIVSDFDIQTDKPVISVGYENCDIGKPFTRAQLFKVLEDRFEHNTYEQEDVSCATVVQNNSQEIDLSIIQREIEELTDRYKNDLLRLIKKHYENR